MTVAQGRLRIGASGDQYDHRAGCFYPAELPRRDWFAHYAGFFDTVEINYTFNACQVRTPTSTGVPRPGGVSLCG